MSHLPDIIIIGAAKAGTTSLFHHLGLHPGIWASPIKELDFFTGHWDRGVPWYRDIFREARAVALEASPSYAKTHRWPETPARMAQVVPDARLIYMVRDPIERAVSHWRHKSAKGKEVRNFREAVLGKPDCNYVKTGEYDRELANFLERYDKSRILVVDFHELIADPRAAMRGVFQFAGVDAEFYSEQFGAAKNITPEDAPMPGGGGPAPRPWAGLRRWLGGGGSPPEGRGPSPDADVLEFLRDHYRPHVERLRKMTGQPFRRWSM